MRDAERTDVYWSQEERDLAAKLFSKENGSGFGHLNYADRMKWYSRARTEILCRIDNLD